MDKQSRQRTKLISDSVQKEKKFLTILDRYVANTSQHNLKLHDNILVRRDTDHKITWGEYFENVKSTYEMAARKMPTYKREADRKGRISYQVIIQY